MKRGIMPIIILVAVLVGAISASAQERFPVSVGITYGTYTPSLDAYNLRFVNQSGTKLVSIGGVDIPFQVRQSIDTSATFFRQTAKELTIGKQNFLFSSAWGMGLHAKVRLHSELFALVEYDWWSQKVGHQRNFGGQIGFEGYDISLSPATASIVFELPTEVGNPWFPNFYVGGGGGVIMVERTTTQITNTTSSSGSKSTATGSGVILTGLAGLEYPMFFLNNRVSLFFEGRYLSGDYTELFPKLTDTGSAVQDDEGKQVNEEAQVSVQGTQLKFGLSVNFGQIRSRPAKGVLTGLIEERSRRGGGGYAMMPQRYGAPMAAPGPGIATMYAQPMDQVQVVQGAAQIDENRIRQIIREELLSARLTTGGSGAAPVDDLAEQQLRSIRERRLQAEQELEQLKELLREES